MGRPYLDIAELEVLAETLLEDDINDDSNGKDVVVMLLESDNKISVSFVHH